MPRLARMSVAAFAVSACASPFPPAAAPAPVPSVAAAGAANSARSGAPYPFTGFWHVVGAGFPEGARDAVMSIVQRDSTFAVRFVSGGPPGRLLSMKVAGDSAAIDWEIDNEGRLEVMSVNVRGVRDSLVGTWRIGSRGGPLTGSRQS